MSRTSSTNAEFLQPPIRKTVVGEASLQDPPPQPQTLTLTIPRRRKSARFASLRPASLRPSDPAADPRPRTRSAGTKKKGTGTSALGVAREHYARTTDWKRRAFTKLHGRIRCVFCLPHPSASIQPRGTFNRLPDAAARHLREVCAHFEGSGMYERYRRGVGGRRLSKKEIVARAVKDREKIAVAQVFCRKDKGHKKRCAELGLTPLDVEERLERHAVLCKAEECECCPHPSFSEYLAKVDEDAKKEEEDRKNILKERKKKRKLKHAVPGQLVHIKEEEEDLGVPELLQTSLKSAARTGNKEGRERRLKRKVPEPDEELEELEVEVAVLLEHC